MLSLEVVFPESAMLPLIAALMTAWGTGMTPWGRHEGATNFEGVFWLPVWKYYHGRNLEGPL